MFSLLDDSSEQAGIEELTDQELPILPLRGTVAFPFIILPLSIGVSRSNKLIRWAVDEGSLVGLVTSKEPEVDEPEPEQLYQTGVVARIHRVVRGENETLQVIIQGTERIRIDAWTQTDPFLKAKVSTAPDIIDDDQEAEIEALRRRLIELSQSIVEHLPQIPNEVNQFLTQVDNPRIIVYTIASNLQMEMDDQLQLLVEDRLSNKMEYLAHLMSRELEILEITRRIRSDTQDELDKAQREFFLRQQLQAIQKELGEDDEGALVNDYRKKIEEEGLPEEAKKEAVRELNRMEKLQSQSAEFGVIQTYLDWMVSLPWGKLTEDNLDIAHAREALNADHYDMDDIKQRILEYLAVRKLRQERNFDDQPTEKGREQDRAGVGSILLFVGPPGVGKTSLGQSIGRALGREFTRMSLGGVRDEAEIRGHRRTYIGAMPGRIIQALKRTGSRNPVFMLDEVDKIGTDWRGDPSSALLEVLDPQQNHAFRDHYLDVDFDLSEVMFIATANTLDTIPAPLRDRMELIQLDGYTEYEKLEIAKGYLIPRQIQANGLRVGEISYSDDGIRQIIRDYTREAGVRNLEREIGRVARKVATKIAGKEIPDHDQENLPAKALVNIEAEQVPDYLGKPKFHFEAAMRTEKAGVATGLAVTAVGGDVLFIEASKMPGKDQLIMTGQLGDVMKESVIIALSYVRAFADKLKIDADKFREADIHLHIPAGAVPKDGPSAGITMVTALVSLLTKRPVRSDVGMTGEISLLGQVLPIGGLKQKILAAHRAGLTTVIFPKLNEADLDDVPQDVSQEMTFHMVETLDQVLEHALSSPDPVQDNLVKVIDPVPVLN